MSPAAAIFKTPAESSAVWAQATEVKSARQSQNDTKNRPKLKVLERVIDTPHSLFTKIKKTKKNRRLFTVKPKLKTKPKIILYLNHQIDKMSR
jgi:hypothetical protein